jgi:MFS transporter, ACS family, D-galactonate transporter
MKALSSYKISLLLLLAASQSLSFIDRVNLSVVLPELIKEHAYTPATAGLLMSIVNWFYVGAIILAGPLTDKIGARRAFPGAVALWSLATALCGLTIQFWPLAVLRAMVGIGEAPNIPSGSQAFNGILRKPSADLRSAFSSPATRSASLSAFRCRPSCSANSDDRRCSI